MLNRLKWAQNKIGNNVERVIIIIVHLNLIKDVGTATP